MFTLRTLEVADANLLCSFRGREMRRLQKEPSSDGSAPTEAEVSFTLREHEEARTRTLVGIFADAHLVGVGVVVNHGRSKGEVGGYVTPDRKGTDVSRVFSGWVRKEWPDYCIMANVDPGKSLALDALQAIGFTEELLAQGQLSWRQAA
ncbi:MAG: hypothetical protein KBE09_00170 [Candidatus Pacebacteria bacterium]|nr:hypothetical protein [Candidatus Paceibacterota bacterium]